MPLGLQDGRILDGQMNASDTLNRYWARNGRLHSTPVGRYQTDAGWAPNRYDIYNVKDTSLMLAVKTFCTLLLMKMINHTTNAYPERSYL